MLCMGHHIYVRICNEFATNIAIIKTFANAREHNYWHSPGETSRKSGQAKKFHKPWTGSYKVGGVYFTERNGTEVV